MPISNGDPHHLLTPAMRGVLARMARARRPPLHTLTVAQARAFYEAGAEVLELPPPPMARERCLSVSARDAGWPLELQLLFYPGCSAWQDTRSHRRFGQGFVLEAETIQWFFRHYVDDAQREDWRFAPLLAPDFDGVAPAWIGLAECDPLVDEGVELADRLRMAAVPVELEIYRGVTHEFIKMGRAVPEAQQALADAARALRGAWGIVGESRESP